MAKVAEIKTKPTEIDPESFINAITDEQKRADSFQVMKMMEKASGEKPVMWGTSIIGYGFKRYKSERSGREVDWFKIGFAPRKGNITLYLLNLQEHTEALEKLGKHKLGGGCLYINKLSDVDVSVLEKMLADTLKSK